MTVTLYTVTFNANDGSGSPEITTQEFLHGTPQALQENTFTRVEHVFLGWATSPTAAVADYEDKAIYTATGNTTLYAVWKEISTPIPGFVFFAGSRVVGGIQFADEKVLGVFVESRTVKMEFSLQAISG